jgi:hypothetical protein
MVAWFCASICCWLHSTLVSHWTTMVMSFWISGKGVNYVRIDNPVYLQLHSEKMQSGRVCSTFCTALDDNENRLNHSISLHAQLIINIPQLTQFVRHLKNKIGQVCVHAVLISAMFETQNLFMAHIQCYRVSNKQSILIIQTKSFQHQIHV